MNKKLASRVKNTENESEPCGASNRTEFGASVTDTTEWNNKNNRVTHEDESMWNYDNTELIRIRDTSGTT